MIFAVRKTVFWGVNAQPPPDEESRKFDIHACEAGMNIKFPFFSCGQQIAHTPKYGDLSPKFSKSRIFVTKLV
jgi:hypothetical protein